ncbi:MAG: response regulator [Kiritimatiellae bacterium]|nr:response regulator [Kiritimatiellia bacterium]
MALRILAVDDDSLVLGVLVRVLGTDPSLQVRTASRGQEAVDIAASQSFDVLICDISLPDLDGNLVVKEMKRRDICPPFVVMVSGIVKTAPQSLTGSMVFVPKPIDPVVLLSLLRSVPRRSGA